MSDDLDNRIRKYYMAQRLPDEDIDTILGATPRCRRGRSAGLAMAALFALLATVAILIAPPERGGTGDQLVQDIVMNHVHHTSGDVRADSFTALASRLDDLPFALRAPRNKKLEHHAFGARRCNLRGAPAVQIHLPAGVSGRGHRSLFVTTVNGADATEAPRTARFRGVDIRVWIEGNLAYALAEG